MDSRLRGNDGRGPSGGRRAAHRPCLERRTATLDLAAHRLRQRVHELDAPRVLVRGGDAPDMLLELGHECIPGLEARGRDHEGGDHLAALGVGQPHHRRLLHRRVLDEGVLHLLRADPVAGRADHVVVAPEVEEVAVLVRVHGVAGDEPPRAPDLEVLRPGALGVVPVAEHELRVRSPDEEPAAGVAGAEPPLPVEHRRLDPRQRAPHRPRLHRHAGVVQHRHQGLGLPVAVEQIDAGPALSTRR